MIEPETLERMQAIADYRTTRRFLKNIGLFAIFVSICNLLMGIMNFKGNFVNYVYFGIVAVVGLVGLKSYLRPSPFGMLLDAFAMALLGVSDIVMPFGGAALPMFGVAVGPMIVLSAFRDVGRYGRVRRIFHEPPSETQLAWLEGVVSEIRNAKAAASEDRIEFIQPSMGPWKGRLLGDILILVDPWDFHNLVVNTRDVEFIDSGKARGGKRKGALRLGRRMIQRVVIHPKIIAILENGGADLQESQ